MWEKYVTRRLAVQVAQAWNFGWGEAMEQVYGLSVRHTLVFKDEKKTEYYVDTKQHKAYIDGLYQLLENQNFLKTFHADARITLENILNQTTRKFEGDLSEYTNNELLSLYRDFLLPNQTQFYIRMWTVFNIGEPLANTVKEYLSRSLTDESRVTEYLLNLSSPLEPNDVLNERMDILKLASKKNQLNEEEMQVAVRQHTEKYQHIPMFDFDHRPYGEQYFLDEINDISEPEKELSELEGLFVHRQKEFERIVQEIKPDEKLMKLLVFLKENVFLRDYRDMIRQKLNLQLRKYYQEVGQRIGLNIEEIALLTNDEIAKHLASGKYFSREEIDKRQNVYLLIQKDSDVEIYSGETALNKAKQELDNELFDIKQEIKGIIGSKGYARGPAKIVYTNKDLAKVKKGDVLVATMTRQDFVPAIRKAVALVTDEGSITAHAAIIAREFKIPCLVNTKNATSILKDGYIVEVDANNGTVKVIEKG